MKQGVLLLGGPTASGKSELAVRLAERFGAEIVGADSRQIYAGMPIGTAVPDAALRARAAHHLLEFLDPVQRYSAARFAADALDAIASIGARGKRAIVAGGTGFYLRALAGDVALSSAYDRELRARIEREARVHPLPVLHDWLAALDPRRAAAVEPADAYRVARALEIARAAGGGEAAEQRSLRSEANPFIKVWLDAPIDELVPRIERRVDAMIEAGFVAEAERIGPGAVASDAVGYPQAFAYLDGLCTAGELRAALVRATRRYAKRQRTWFRAEPGAIRIQASELGAAAAEIARIAGERLRWTEI